MFIDATVKNGRVNDRTSREQAAAQRRGIYGKAVRVPRAWKDNRQVVIDLANQGHEYDDWLDSWIPPSSNEFVIRRQAV